YQPGHPIRRKYYWLCLASFAAALLSKEIVVTLPALLLLLDIYPLRRLPATQRRWMEAQVRAVWFEKIPFFALSLGMIVVVQYRSTRMDLFDAMAGMGRLSRIAAAIYNLAFYLGKTVAPVRLSPLYEFTPHKIDPAAAPFLFSSRRLHTILVSDWSSDVCSSDLSSVGESGLTLPIGAFSGPSFAQEV